MCEGNMRFDSGKFHNHCSECPNHGKCTDCGSHYFSGLSGFPCDTCERRKEGFGGPRGRGRRGGGGNDCIIS